MTVDFAEWAEQERRQPKPRLVRPSLELDAALVARVDRVARIQGLSRHELVAHILDRWLASWRPLHDERTGL